MNKGNLVIVDDEPTLVKLLAKKLKEYADNIFTAANGEEALVVLAKQKIHCVICDVSMPKMDGIQLIKKMRSDNNPVPFVFYTGVGNHEMMLEVAKYGAFDFFNKPDFTGLEEVIVRGLKEGFNRPSETGSELDFVSEYQKLLNEMK
ncbi:MAG TPA: response regulator [Bacteriovoracaceae bacterium]|nr:response regulator [Bacteriovoracaceae bacterium]